MKMGNFEYVGKVKVGNKERFDKEQIGIKEPLPVTNLPFTRATKKFLIAKFHCTTVFPDLKPAGITPLIE